MPVTRLEDIQIVLTEFYSIHVICEWLSIQSTLIINMYRICIDLENEPGPTFIILTEKLIVLPLNALIDMAKYIWIW